MDVVVLAGATMAVYLMSFAIFKIASGRMQRLSGRRPFRLVGQVLGSRWWLLGLLMILLGFAMEGAVLSTLPLGVAVPVFGSGLVFLLLIGIGWFGERLSAREWLAMTVTVAALVALALSAGLLPVPGLPGGPPGDSVRLAGPAWAVAVPLWKPAVVAVPSVLLPIWMLGSRDHGVDGRHARPLTGVAYGIGAGVLLGTAELSGMGTAWMMRSHRSGLFATPHPYVVLLAGALGLGLLQVALQRCRLSIVVTVVTITAKAHLLLAGTLLSGQPWPRDGILLALRIGGLLLAALAVLTFPHHEQRPRAVLPAPGPGPGSSAAPPEVVAYTGNHRRVEERMSTT
jgi:multidrug transporter EmrE-like cation transporter